MDFQDAIGHNLPMIMVPIGPEPHLYIGLDSMPVEIVRIILRFLCPHCTRPAEPSRASWSYETWAHFAGLVRERRAALYAISRTSRWLRVLATPYMVHDVETRYALTKFFRYIVEKGLRQHVKILRIFDEFEGQDMQDEALEKLIQILFKLDISNMSLGLLHVARSEMSMWKIRDFLTKVLFLFLDHVHTWQIPVGDGSFASGCPTLMRDLEDQSVLMHGYGEKSPGLRRINFVKRRVRKLCFHARDPLNLSCASEFLTASPNVQLVMVKRCHQIPMPLDIPRMMFLTSFFLVESDITALELHELIRHLPHLTNFFYQSDHQQFTGNSHSQQITLSNVLDVMENSAAALSIRRILLDFSNAGSRRIPMRAHDMYHSRRPRLPRLQSFIVDTITLVDEIEPFYNDNRAQLLRRILPVNIQTIGIIDTGSTTRAFAVLAALAADIGATATALPNLKAIYAPQFIPYLMRPDCLYAFRTMGIRIYTASYVPLLAKDPVIRDRVV